MFIRIAATATIYCSVISIIVIRNSALMDIMLKQKKKPMNKVKLKNILSYRLAISLICQECMISLNSVSSLTEQTQTYLKSTYKSISKMTWSQLGNIAIIVDIAR